MKYDLINFMDAGVKYVDFSIENFDVNAFLDIFDIVENEVSIHQNTHTTDIEEILLLDQEVKQRVYQKYSN